MKNTTEPGGNAAPRPANQLLLELERGKVHQSLTDAIAEVTQRVTDSGKAGSVTLKLSISPAKLNDPAVLIGADIATKVPKEQRDPSIFFVDDDGGLHRSNPRQPELPLKPVRTDREAV